jgi:hypothetical protein
MIDRAETGDEMDKRSFQMVTEDMGGWVRVFMGRGEPTGELAKFLSHSLTEWVRKRPHLRLQIVVPVVRDGDTVELHAWYDQVIFPDAGRMKAKIE